MQIRWLKNVDLQRFWLIFSTDIANFKFAFSVFFKRFADTRFQQNHDTAKTLQNKHKMRNFDAFALSETLKFRIPIGNYSYFQFPAIVAKPVWWTQMVFVRSTLRTTSLRPSLQTLCFRSTLRTLRLRQNPAAAAELAKPRHPRSTCKGERGH